MQCAAIIVQELQAFYHVGKPAVIAR